MKIEDINHYRDHGCNIKGDLVKVDYNKHWEDFGSKQFGSMSIFDSIDLAFSEVKKVYPEATKALSIPVLICHKNKS